MFGDKVSCIPDWPQTWCVAKDDLELLTESRALSILRQALLPTELHPQPGKCMCTMMPSISFKISFSSSPGTFLYQGESHKCPLAVVTNFTWMNSTVLVMNPESRSLAPFSGKIHFKIIADKPLVGTPFSWAWWPCSANSPGSEGRRICRLKTGMNNLMRLCLK